MITKHITTDRRKIALFSTNRWRRATVEGKHRAILDILEGNRFLPLIKLQLKNVQMNNYRAATFLTNSHVLPYPTHQILQNIHARNLKRESKPIFEDKNQRNGLCVNFKWADSHLTHYGAVEVHEYFNRANNTRQKICHCNSNGIFLNI